MEQNRREFLKDTLLASAALALPGVTAFASVPAKSGPEVEFDCGNLGEFPQRYSGRLEELDTGNPLDQTQAILNWLLEEQGINLHPRLTLFGPASSPHPEREAKLESPLYWGYAGYGFQPCHSDLVVCSMERTGRALRDLSTAVMFLADSLYEYFKCEWATGFTIPCIEAVDRHKDVLLPMSSMQTEEEIEELMDEPHVCISITSQVYVPGSGAKTPPENLTLQLQDVLPRFDGGMMYEMLRDSYEYHGSIFN